MPEEICQLYYYIKFLKFNETPKYRKIEKLLQNSLSSYGYYKIDDILLDYAWVISSYFIIILGSKSLRTKTKIS